MTEESQSGIVIPGTQTEEEVPPPEPTEPPPPPVEAPPVQESLAEQVYRESHTVPESTGPSDYVPNRPNIRPPDVVEEVLDPDALEAGGVGTQGEVLPEEAESEEPVAGRASAADLIAQAQAATTQEELDEIEAQADGRVTVENAVRDRREALGGTVV